MNIKFHTSKQFTLDLRDVSKGLIVACVTAAFTAVQTAFDDDLNFQWKKVVIAAVIAGAAYLTKNLFAPSQIVIKEDKNPDGPIKPLDI